MRKNKLILLGENSVKEELNGGAADEDVFGDLEAAEERGFTRVCRIIQGLNAVVAWNKSQVAVKHRSQTDVVFIMVDRMSAW